jgi:hypothetical protein
VLKRLLSFLMDGDNSHRRPTITATTAAAAPLSEPARVPDLTSQAIQLAVMADGDDVATVEQVLSGGADPNRSSAGLSLAKLATTLHKPRRLKLLIQRGAVVTGDAQMGLPIMHLAIAGTPDRAALSRAMAVRGIDLDAGAQGGNYEGLTADQIDAATQRASLATLIVLLNAGIDPNTVDGERHFGFAPHRDVSREAGTRACAPRCRRQSERRFEMGSYTADDRGDEWSRGHRGPADRTWRGGRRGGRRGEATASCRRRARTFRSRR